MSVQLPIFRAIANSNINILNIELIKIILDYYSFAAIFDKGLIGHTELVTCVTNLPNGDIVTGSRDKTLKIWNLETGNCIKTLIGHTNEITCVNVLLDGRIISGSLDNILKIWNPLTGNCDFSSGKRKYSLTNTYISDYRIHRIDVINTGLIFVSFASYSFQIETFNSKTCNYEHHICNIGIGDNYVVIPSNGRIVIYSRSGKISIRDVDSCTHLLRDSFSNYVACMPQLPNKTVLRMAVLTDNCVVDVSVDGTLNFWNIETKQLILTKSLEYTIGHGYVNLTVLANGVINVKIENKVIIVKIKFINNNKFDCDIVPFSTYCNEIVNDVFALSTCQFATTLYYSYKRNNNTLCIWT